MPASDPSSSTASAAPAESIERPAPGLAQGRWEAPPWAFWIAAIAAVLGGLAWLAVALRTRRAPR